MSEFKVGLLALFALASVVFMSLKITSNKGAFGDYVPYQTILDDASGVVEKTPIKVAGINAGRIKSIKLQGNKALVDFEMIDDIKMTPNSKLQVKSVGFLGDKYLDIDLGEATEKRLEPGSLVPAAVAGGLDSIGKDAGAMIKEIKEVAILIKESLREQDGTNRLEKITGNVKDLTASLKRMLEKNEGKVDEIVENIKQMTEQLQFETDRLQKDSLMADLTKIGPILEKADKAVGDLKDIISDVKDGKGTVGKLLRDDAVVDQVSQTLSSVNRLVNRINNIEADIGLSTGANTRLGSDTRFDLDIYPAPERFFRLGVVTNQFGPNVPKEQESCSTTDGGAETCTQSTKTYKNQFKFNLQIGRRIQRFGIRAGIIESTGGVGLDYYLPDWGIRTGLEVFNYQKDAGPYARLISEVKIWNVLFARVAAEDLISKEGKQSGTFSLGLRFNDQDLAALIGLLAR
ncbi:MAG: MlaD family protein [Bacteriovoracaceae bacterium]|nr:MlaD family protein [Bacteriovoracaceae bacterium]